MKKMIFFIIISIFPNFSNTLFCSWSNHDELVKWAGLRESISKKDYENAYFDIEDQFDSKRIKKEQKRSFSLERLSNKKRSLSLDQRRRRKSIEQNEIKLNHREMVACMMCCSCEKYN